MLRWSLRFPRYAPSIVATPRILGVRGMRSVRRQRTSGVRSLAGLDVYDNDGGDVYPGTAAESKSQPCANSNDINPLDNPEPSTKFANELTMMHLDGKDVRETVFHWPSPTTPPSSSQVLYEGPHGDLYQTATWMEQYLGKWVEGEPTKDVTTPLAAANHYLDGMAMGFYTEEQRSEAFFLFLRAFLNSTHGGPPAAKLIRRQASENIRYQAHGAITAFKAARQHRPPIQQFLHILPNIMNEELISIVATELVNDLNIAPDALRSMIGRGLAGLRRQEADAKLEAETASSSETAHINTTSSASLMPSSESSTHPPSSASASAPPYSAAYLAMHTRKDAIVKEIPAYEWDLRHHFPLILSHFATIDFRGALRALNDMRTAARWQRELAIAEGREWPGTATGHLVDCYTAVLSLWLRSHLKNPFKRSPGVRIHSAVPIRLAVDLGNLLVPFNSPGTAEAPAKVADTMAETAISRQEDGAQAPTTSTEPQVDGPRPDATTEATRQADNGPLASQQEYADALALEEVGSAEALAALAETEPMTALANALFITPALLMGETGTALNEERAERYHPRNPFLASWFNGERIANNVEIAAAIWQLISGQSVAASIAGIRPPITPTPEQYESFFTYLMAWPPTSFRPLVDAIFDDGEGVVEPEVFDVILGALARVPLRKPVDWSGLAVPWMPPAPPVATLPHRPIPRAPRPAPSPDLALMFVMMDEHPAMFGKRALNHVAAAIIRAAKQGAIPTRTRGRTAHLVLSMPTGPTHFGHEIWKWFNLAMWEKEEAEARRTGRQPQTLPTFPVRYNDMQAVEAQEYRILRDPDSIVAEDKGEEGEEDGEKEGKEEGEDKLPALTKLVYPAMKRLLFDTILARARLRGDTGTAAEVFAAELGEIKAAMKEKPEPYAPVDWAGRSGINDAADVIDKVDLPSETRLLPRKPDLDTVWDRASKHRPARAFDGKAAKSQTWIGRPTQNDKDDKDDEVEVEIRVEVNMKEPKTPKGTKRRKRLTNSGMRKRGSDALMALVDKVEVEWQK